MSLSTASVYSMQCGSTLEFGMNVVMVAHSNDL